ncbi:LacI family transcriptional regulator [Deltaproteobacteria bacterium Smac51]|nr:LacI family transcriptional regulator [Deltaproteobacteria bacterium Smac51]
MLLKEAHLNNLSKKRNPTIVDVAREAGVAPSTVSHALNNKGYVEARTKEKILKVVKELGYRPNQRARRLRMGGAKTIALISAMPLGVSGGASKLGFLMEIAAVAAEEAMKKGLALILVPPQPLDSEPPILEVDGAIVVEPMADDPHMQWLTDSNLPVVCLGRWPGRDDESCVDLLSGYTAELLLEHLKAAGARNIAVMVGARERTSYVETEAAYREFCRRESQTPLLFRLDEEAGEMAGQLCAAKLFQDNPEVDGLLALVDAFAVGAVKAAEGCNLKIPEDLKIATRYDGLRAKLCRPPLTAVDLHLQEVAALGVELLVRRLERPEQALLLRPQNPTLVVRESTGRGPDPTSG